MRHQRWIVLSFVIAAGLVFVTMDAALASAFAQFGLEDQKFTQLALGGRGNPGSLSITTTSVLAFLGGATTFIALIRNKKAVAFTDEVVDELSKVTWPTKDETIRATTTVVVTTAIVAALLGVYDFMWKNVADAVLLETNDTEEGG